jgi:hypothetical protein
MTILGTSETDVAKIENHFTAESEQDYIQFLALKDCKDEVLSGQLECS